MKKVEVRRGEAKAPAKGLPHDDLTVDGDRSPQHPARAGQVAELHRLADHSARDRALAQHDLRRHLDVVASGLQGGWTAQAVLPELAVKAQHEAPGAQPPLEDALAEVVRRRVTELLVEGQHHRVTDARAPQERELVLEGREGPGCPSQQDRLGVLREGHHRGLRTEQTGPGHVRLQDRLVAQMNPIEDPNARHRSLSAGFEAIDRSADSEAVGHGSGAVGAVLRLQILDSRAVAHLVARGHAVHQEHAL